MKGQQSKRLIFDEAYELAAERSFITAQENFVVNYWAFRLRSGEDPNMLLFAIKRWVRKCLLQSSISLSLSATKE